MAKTQWTADEHHDAYGWITIRLADGTDSGNLDAEPIATVYDQADADRIILAVNAHDDLLAACRLALRCAKGRDYEHIAVDASGTVSLGAVLRAAIAKATKPQ